jgi:hypothetical protein
VNVKLEMYVETVSGISAKSQKGANGREGDLTIIHLSDIVIKGRR